MKQLLFLIFCLLFISANSLAQTSETFDVATFKPSAGWKKQLTENAVQYMTEDPKTGTSCIIMLTKAIPGLGDSRANFAAAWKTMVKGMVTVSTPPEMQPAEVKDGWETLSGYAPSVNEGSKGVVILVTASGFEKMVNLVIFTNTNVYEKNISDFLASVSLKKPTGGASKKESVASQEPTLPPASKSGFAFTTSNFDDGWNSTEQPDWVEVTKGGTTVLLHYGIQYTDATRNFPSDNKKIEHYWNLLISPRYRVSNINLTPTDYGKYDRVYFGDADGTEISTGNKAHIALMITSENGFAKCVEIITPDKAALTQQFPNYDKIKEMNNYNKFAVSIKDLPGTWENSSAIYSQYYNTNTGNYAGMGGVSINAKFIFKSNNTFHFDYIGVSGMMSTPDVYTEKRDGKFTVNNWEMTITDKNENPVSYSAQFEAIKGGRILHLQNKQFSGLKYHLYKQK